jgi:hypothetical protein
MLMSESSPSTRGDSSNNCCKSYEKKPYLKKGGGGGISCSKARSLKCSENALSPKEKMDLLEKMQKDHLEKLEIRLKRRSKQAKNDQLQCEALVKRNGSPLESLTLPPQAPENTADSSAESSSIREILEPEFEEGLSLYDANCVPNSGVSEDCVVDGNYAVADNDRIQLQRLKRRLTIALRESERERQAVSSDAFGCTSTLLLCNVT